MAHGPAASTTRPWNSNGTCPAWPHLQNPDRVAAARTAIDEFHCRVIVLDDAFQHRRIGRNMDLVLLDALEPLGFGHVFPRGTLREPLEGLGRADLVALSRADLLSADERQRLRGLVEPYAPQAAWLEIAHTARSLLASDRSEQPLTWFGRPTGVGLLWDRQSGRLPPHAGHLRLPGGWFPRVPRSPRLQGS